MQQNLKIFGTL